MDLEKTDPKSPSLMSPRHDEFEQFLEEFSGRRQQQPEQMPPLVKKTNFEGTRQEFRRMLHSSSSNQNLMASHHDTSMDVEEPQPVNKYFETQNSQEDESSRYFKKKAEESFSIEYTSRREDSSESFSQRSSRSNFIPQEYKLEEENNPSDLRASFSSTTNNNNNNNNTGPAALVEEKDQSPVMVMSGGCNCKRSKCLKLYCECFHLRVFCTELCKCYSCGNHKDNPIEHRQAIIEALSRNPAAFEQEFRPLQNPERANNINAFSLGVELEEVRRGCKCKKTKCLKKYCQCFGNGELCSVFCKCEECENGGKGNIHNTSSQPITMKLNKIVR